MKFKLHQYTVSDLSKFSAKFLNTIVDDFTNNIIELYTLFRDLIMEHKRYAKIVEKTMDHLITKININTNTDEYIVNGYSTPFSKENIKADTVNGIFYLDNLSETSKYGTTLSLDTNTEIPIATTITKIGTGASYNVVNNWTAETQIAKSCGELSNLWYKELSDEYIYVSITNGSYVSNIISYISVYPIAGTKVSEIYYKKSANSYTTISVDSEFPSKNIVNDYFQNEIILKLKGYDLNNGNYGYGLRNIDVGTYDYVTTGKFSFVIPVDFDDRYIKNITSTIDYEGDIFPIRVVINHNSSPIYDSNSDTFPYSGNLLLEGGAVNDVEITLSKYSNNTPVFREFNIEFV